MSDCINGDTCRCSVRPFRWPWPSTLPCMLSELHLWRRKIDTVTRRLVRHEANVAICDRVVACLEMELFTIGYTNALGYMPPCGRPMSAAGLALAVEVLGAGREMHRPDGRKTVAHGERRIQEWHVQHTLTAKTRKLSASGAMLTALCIYTCVRALAYSPCGRDATRTAAVRVLLAISRGPMIYTYVDL